MLCNKKNKVQIFKKNIMGIIKSVKERENIILELFPVKENFFVCVDKHTDLLQDELKEDESYSLSLMVKTSEFKDKTGKFKAPNVGVTKNYSSKKVEKLIDVSVDFFNSLLESSHINEICFGHYNNDRAFFKIYTERYCDYKRVFTFILNKSKML